MTEKAKSRTSLSQGQVIFSICSIIALALSFVCSDALLESMKRGMQLCVTTVLPSLFPFAVLSELTVRSGAADGVARLFGKAFEKLFGIRREGAIALVLGLLCGFPIGTRSAISLYERGKLSRGELERLLCFCNGPSPAFLVGAVGVSLFGSREFGILLLVAELVSCLAVGILLRWLFGKDGELSLGACVNPCPRRLGACENITLAVSESAKSMISVCAFIIFFSAFGGVIRACLDTLRVPDGAMALVMGALELTGGALAVSELEPPLSCLLCAAVVGWSGLSVHFQLISICGEHKIRLGRYFCAKLCRAAIDVAVVAAGMRIFDGKIVISEGAAESFLHSGRPSALGIFSLFLFAIGAFSLCRREKVRKK